MNNLTEIYASQLKTRLATKAGMNQGQIEAVLGNFNKLVKAGGPEIAFRVMMNSYGNEDTEKACRTIKEAIQNALEKFNKENRVDVNPRSRLKSLIERHNKTLDQCAIEINGVGLSKDDIDHYQKIVVALAETIRLMKEIDVVIDQHGGWPGAFK